MNILIGISIGNPCLFNFKPCESQVKISLKLCKINRIGSKCDD